MHALRQNCGSFLHDSIRREWPLPEEGGIGDRGRHKRTKRLDRADSMAESAPRPEGSRDGPQATAEPREWPLFTTPCLTRLRVTGFNSREGQTYYVVAATMESCHWTVERAYDEFAQLHKTLVHGYGVAKGLMPSRWLLGYFGSPKQEQLEAMQQQLESFLASLLSAFSIPPTELLKFLEYPFTDVLSVTQQLAAFFYDEGDYVLANNRAVQMSPLQLHCVLRRCTLPMPSSTSGQMKDDFGNLLDFVQRLKKLKIAPPTDETCVLSPSEKFIIDLSMMKGLEVLLIESIAIGNMRGRRLLPAQLTALEVRRSIRALKDILVVHPEEEEEGDEAEDKPLSPVPSAPDLSGAPQWTALKQAVFKLCNLSNIDESIRLLPSLERLDLSFNSLEEIDNLVDLPHLRVLDVSHNKISSLESLHTKVGNITKVSFASNKIVSLDGLQRVYSLEFIDLSNNNITEFSEASHLSSLDCLEELYLRGNQIAHSHTYRTHIFSYLQKNASRVALEGRRPSKDELEVSSCLLTPRGHRRVPSRTADIRPDLDNSEAKEAEGELEVAMSVTNQLEKLRKEGGDQWLSIFNAERVRSIEDRGGDKFQEGGVVAPRSPKRRRSRGRQQLPHSRRKGKRKELESSWDGDGSLLVEEEDGTERDREACSRQLQQCMTLQLQEALQTTESFLVTVLDYGASFHSLSSEDVDQILLNSRMEECAISIDSSLKRVQETIVSAAKTRCQRDLALLQVLRAHEGARLAACLEFSSFNSPSSWVVYCVPDRPTLARLYVALQRAAEGSRERTPDSSLGPRTPDRALEATPPPREDTDSPGEMRGKPAGPVVTTEERCKEPDGLISLAQLSLSASGVSTASSAPTASSQTSSKSPTPVHSSPGTPAGARTPAGTSTPERPRSPAEQLLMAPGSHASGRTSGRSSPMGSDSPLSRRSAAGGTPVLARSVEMSSSASATSVEKAITATRAEAARGVAKATSAIGSSAEPSPELGRQAAATELRLHTGPVARKVVRKPQLSSPALFEFFASSVAGEPEHEVLMHVLWCGCSLPSAPSIEVEAGLLISNHTVYVLEVLEPERHPKKQLSWTGPAKRLPLATVFRGNLFHLSRVFVGLFDQHVVVEFADRGTTQSIAAFPRTSENTIFLTEQLKAGLDACGIAYHVTSAQEMIANSSSKPSGILFLNSDSSDLLTLKECLVQPRVVTKTSSYIAACKTQEVAFSVEVEVKRMTQDFCTKFEISQYISVNMISSDILPLGNGTPHLRPSSLVLTNDYLYLCSEEVVLWPRDHSCPIKPRYPRCCVLDSHPIVDVQEVKICDRAQPITSLSDPVYEFLITFEATSDASAVKGVSEWHLCVHEKQYLDQLVLCLSSLWGDVRHSQLSVLHTADSVVTLDEVRGSRRRSGALTAGDGHRVAQPRAVGSGPAADKSAFVSSTVLVRFASFTNYQRCKIFKRHIAQAEFMKSDETLISVFLARSSLPQAQAEPLEIEVCVLVSNYCVYFLADLEGVQAWLQGGGPASFSRMSLLSKKDAGFARCFYFVWLNELRQVTVGLFHLAVKITEAKQEDGIVVHTQNASTTLSFLAALSSQLLLRDSEEEDKLSELLSDYIDLAELTAGKPSKPATPTVELLQPSEEGVVTVKQILLSISPSITRNSSPAQCVASLHVLCEQVMLLVEEVRIRDAMATQCHAHLVLLTNYGLYVCAHAAGERFSPAVLAPADVRVKKWCHIDLVEYLEVSPALSTRSSHAVLVHVRSQKSSSHSDTVTIHLVPQSLELLRFFVHSLSLLWHERCGRQLPVYRVPANT